VKLKETDLYNPIRNLLTEQGFTVRGEVKGCDIVAVKGDIVWVVEMKLSANITLIYQAMDRKAATDWVFIAVPRPKGATRGTFLKLTKLVKKLQIGLITVALDSPVKHAEIIVFPVGKDSKTNKRTAILKREVAGRTVDTTGGATKTQINTAFRERSVQLACLLEEKGVSSPKELIALGCAKDAAGTLYSNVLGWFKRVGRGMYELSELGSEYLNANASTSLIIYYRMKAKSIYNS